MSYSFEYLGLILELFPVFTKNSNFYCFELKKDNEQSKKVKLDIRQDKFLIQNEIVELSDIGKAWHSRISEWNQKFMGMSFNKGK